MKIGVIKLSSETAEFVEQLRAVFNTAVLVNSIIEHGPEAEITLDINEDLQETFEDAMRFVKENNLTIDVDKALDNQEQNYEERCLAAEKELNEIKKILLNHIAAKRD